MSKNISNIEDVKYIPLDKIIGNKKITDKSNVVDIGLENIILKLKMKKELQEPVYSSWYEETQKVACNFVKNYQ